MFTKEDYISLETAKLLKEKGFNEPCNASVLKDGTLTVYDKLQSWEDMVYNTNDEYLEFLAPTLYEVQKWLREKHNIHLNVPCTAYIKRYDGHNYICEIFNLSHPQYKYTPIYTNYQQALEAGIRTALELI